MQHDLIGLHFPFGGHARATMGQGDRDKQFASPTILRAIVDPRTSLSVAYAQGENRRGIPRFERVVTVFSFVLFFFVVPAKTLGPSESERTVRRRQRTRSRPAAEAQAIANVDRFPEKGTCISDDHCFDVRLSGGPVVDGFGPRLGTHQPKRTSARTSEINKE